MKKLFFLLIPIFYLLSTNFLGCGYTTRGQALKEYKTIYIKPVVNKIEISKEQYMAKYNVYWPMLETAITQEIASKFLSDGNIKPVQDEAKADLVIKIELIDFRRDVLRYDREDEPQEYRISIGVDVSLWDNHRQKFIWENKRFYGESTHFIWEADESFVLDKAIQDLSCRIIEYILEEW